MGRREELLSPGVLARRPSLALPGDREAQGRRPAGGGARKAVVSAAWRQPVRVRGVSVGALPQRKSRITGASAHVRSSGDRLEMKTASPSPRRRRLSNTVGFRRGIESSNVWLILGLPFGFTRENENRCDLTHMTRLRDRNIRKGQCHFMICLESKPTNPLKSKNSFGKQRRVS